MYISQSSIQYAKSMFIYTYVLLNIELLYFDLPILDKLSFITCELVHKHLHMRMKMVWNDYRIIFMSIICSLILRSTRDENIHFCHE